MIGGLFSMRANTRVGTISKTRCSSTFIVKGRQASGIAQA